MLVPEAWENDTAMSDARRAFYEYHAALVEPWDGPAALAFTDGTRIGATLDRNGLRPLRYAVTRDGLVVLASEAGVLDLDPARVVRRERLAPGRMLLVDTAAGRVLEDDEIKESLAHAKPYRAWLEADRVPFSALPPAPLHAAAAPSPVNDGPAALVRHARQQLHGYTREELKLVLAPMAQSGEEPVGSMGNDTPLAVLSAQPQPLFNYFRQLFAQVTNPPIDPIREALVMSLRTTLGAERNLLAETPAHCRQLVLEHPVLSPEEFARLVHNPLPAFRVATLPMLQPVGADGAGLRAALEHLCARATEAVTGGASVLVLSDRAADDAQVPLPSLLATAAVHHHLLRAGLRTACSLVVQSDEAREVMHFCLLLGYGASAVHPTLACETVAELAQQGRLEGLAPEEAVTRYLRAANKGLVKTMSKMGISTVQSYRGAQLFEALGLAADVIEQYFPGTASRLGGLDLDAVAREYAARQQRAQTALAERADLDAGGQYQWRRRGELHQYDPDAVASLQHAVRAADYTLFKKYSATVNAESRRRATLRGLLRFRSRIPVPLEEVEPARTIVTRFKTGAMSFGSISREAHETLALAMNRLGAKSNSGEGGEDPARFEPRENGDSVRSAIKQVASGRFGVTSHYLVNADELQIKMAQGAKPGEGGQLPGHKVDETIARVRHATPGVALISPPPHHDIYSIEDLAQLIFDLKNANDRARISVKLVSEVGVGTVAAGVAKARADVILVSGDSGGTGAAPLSSIKHAGVPWELGLAETQQVLVLNGLRGRVRLETDGQLRTGRDVAIAALLGAEEFGFATAALVASGCVLMRACHLNTCPVGIATQDPELRQRFAGQPEHVITFMLFVAQELREIMASLGFRTVDEMVGQVEVLEADPDASREKTQGLDLGRVLYLPPGTETAARRWCEPQEHGLTETLDGELIARSRAALERAEPVALTLPIRNTDRAVCTRLSSEVSRRYGAAGLPAGTLRLRFEGTAGQSFCAFLAAGVEVVLAGEANDHLAKGLSGGRVVVMPPSGAAFVAEDNVIAGNVALYGATRGELFLRGRAGERFAVRNSGATAVVEGVGDHGCEYMTGGTVVVLGPTGRNFAAGMSGGIAYVLDHDGQFASRCNRAMVDLESPDEHDLATLRALVHRHYEYTGSAVAWRALARWRSWSARIVKVMPVEYRRVLAARGPGVSGSAEAG
jgi:glutamate synthase domain-containing protein 2/glutamate synthase domain-containing protein 3